MTSLLSSFRLLPRSLAPVTAARLASTMSAASFFDLKAPLPNGTDFDFKTLEGKVTLICNTASACGFTPQLTGLEALHKKFKDQGVAVLGFPCNQFGGQEPGSDADVATFCERNHGVTFPLMKKSDVNGANTSDVYKYLKSQKSGLLFISAIKWNFEKFLVNQKGEVTNRYASTTKPESIAADIEKLLAQK